MKTDICNQYLTALNEGNLKHVLSLFTPDAVVSSPLYGDLPASQFYSDLFEDTEQSDTTLLNIFKPEHETSSLALHFLYKWTLQNGKIVEFECVDVFELNESGQQFKKLKIIYDTHLIRSEHSKLKNGTSV